MKTEVACVLLALVFLVAAPSIATAAGPSVQWVDAPSAERYASSRPEQEPNQEKEKQPDEKKKSTDRREPTAEKDTRKVLSRVVREFTDSIEGLTPSSLRDVIEEEKFYDYPRFEEELTQFLRSAGEVRFFARQVSSEIKEDRAVVILDAEMVFANRLDPDRRETRREQIIFDFLRTDAGWKITEIKPRSFFLP